MSPSIYTGKSGYRGADFCDGRLYTNAACTASPWPAQAGHRKSSSSSSSAERFWAQLMQERYDIMTLGIVGRDWENGGLCD